MRDELKNITKQEVCKKAITIIDDIGDPLDEDMLKICEELFEAYNGMTMEEAGKIEFVSTPRDFRPNWFYDRYLTTLCQEASEEAFADVWLSPEDDVWDTWVYNWQAIFSETFPLTNDLKEAIKLYKQGIGPLPHELKRKFADDVPRCVVKDGKPVPKDQIIMTSN